MKLSLFIARRYLFSKKSHNAINVISAISVCGVALATLALVCTLSVFNGFQQMVADLFT
ncbi:MAG: ABC transporter permease, partial [Bacteroidaceae bacterium]|nr:ABC transporter permease [Bacteroidaceae bacterium]